MKTLKLLIGLTLLLQVCANGQQTNILLVSSLLEVADPYSNIVYTPAFSAAWTMLKEDVVKEEIMLKESPPIVGLLNNVSCRPDDKARWVAQAGFVSNGIIDSIKRSMKTTFGTVFSDLDEFKNIDDAIICLASFYDDVRFKVPFNTMDWNFFSNGNNTSVSCFGVAKSDDNDIPDGVRDQVKIYDYRNPDDFIVVIKCSDNEKEIILAKTGFRKSLSYMKDLVYDRIDQTYPENLNGRDELIIPRIDLSATQRYDELINKRLVNKGFEKYFFVRADQSVDFKMSESGATVKATGTIVLVRGPVPRIYSFDKPFLIIMKKRNTSDPSFLTWIADEKFLVKTGQNR